MFLFLERIIFPGFGKTPRQARRFTLNVSADCRAIHCGSTHHSNVATLILAQMWRSVPRLYGLYGLLGLGGGYALVMFFNPVRRALADGFRCAGRYKRIWITFALLGFGYFVFQFVTFTPVRD